MGKYLYIIKKAISNLFGNRLNYYQECYYNRITNQYKSANNYLALYKKCVIDNSIKTATEIFFSAELKFNCSIKDVKKKLHAPNYHIRTFSNTNTEILIYRTLTGQYKVKYQLHFFEGKLFLFNYTFSNIKKEEEVAIIAILKKKYLGSFTSPCGQNIIDDFNNCIHIEDSAELTINYLFLDAPFFESIKLQSENKEKTQRRKSKANNRMLYARI